MHRRYILWVSLGLFSLLLGACGAQSAPPLTPAPDRPTFLYFYTDN